MHTHQNTVKTQISHSHGRFKFEVIVYVLRATVKGLLFLGGNGEETCAFQKQNPEGWIKGYLSKKAEFLSKMPLDKII